MTTNVGVTMPPRMTVRAIGAGGGHHPTEHAPIRPANGPVGHIHLRSGRERIRLRSSIRLLRPSPIPPPSLPWVLGLASMNLHSSNSRRKREHIIDRIARNTARASVKAVGRLFPLLLVSKCPGVRHVPMPASPYRTDQFQGRRQRLLMTQGRHWARL